MEAPLARILPDNAPFWTAQVTLGLVIEGQLRADHTIGGKEQLLQVASRASMIIATWNGEYRSDLFTVPLERCAHESRVRAATIEAQRQARREMARK
jgi:hypothetical protein